MTSWRYLPALVVLFIGSGCAALIYEIVWFQLLQLVIGSSSISLGILLGTFMGGMCLGSVLMPGAVSPRQHPLRVYASLEAGIGVLGLLILFGMPLVGGLYTAWAGDGMVSVFVRAIVAGICLLPPTMLMGATLPAISRWVKATPEGVSWLGFFYGGNIAGGVVGSLVAGFYLLRVHDVNIATFTAVAINAAVAAIAYLVSAKAAYDEVARPFQGREGGAESPAPPRHASVYVTIALSGLTALGAEVVWTRLLSLHFGATVYTFSLILAVFLVGLGVGSTVASLVARDQASARRALGWCQLLLCGAAAWAAYMLTESLTYWPINPSISTSPWYTFQLDLVRCLWVVLPGLLVAYGRYAATRVGQADVIYVGEGLNATVAVSELSNGVRNYHNAGKVQASSEPQDMRLQRMLGHMTTLLPRQAKNVLVIGCGAGVTAGAVSVDPSVEHETIAEIEPLVPRVVSTYFSQHNFDVVRNPKVHIRIDDARHFVETTSEKFDAVTSDPLDPWVKGAAMLYTQEFFELAKSHLNPGGVMTLFVQLYESNTDAVKSEIATFLDVFPNGVVWGNTNEGKGYDLVLLGPVESASIDVDALNERLKRPEYEPVARSLREIGMTSAIDLFSTYAGRRSDLAAWLRDAQINHDKNLRLQYLAGLGLNLYQADVIYADMLKHVTKLPEDLFVASEQTKKTLFAAILNAQGRSAQ